MTGLHIRKTEYIKNLLTRRFEYEDVDSDAGYSGEMFGLLLLSA